MTTTQSVRPHLGSPDAVRWVCACREPAVLLGMADVAAQTVTIKWKDRVFVVEGTVKTRCPRCGQKHDSGLEVAR